MSEAEVLNIWDVLRNKEGQFTHDHVLSAGMMIIRKSHSLGEIESVIQLCPDLQFFAERRKREIANPGKVGREREYGGG